MMYDRLFRTHPGRIAFFLIFMLLGSLAFPIPHVRATSFPVIETATGGSNTTEATSTPVPLPTGSGGVVIGDLLIVVFCIGVPQSLPAGWTSIAFGNADTVRCRAMDRIATGSEGSTLTVTHDNAAGSFYQAFRIVGQSGLATGAAAAALGQDGTAPPNPPNFDTTQGVETNLWIAVGAFAENVATATVWNITGVPSSYTSVRQTDGIFPTPPAKDGGIRSGFRLLSAQAENPGAFTMTTSGGSDMNWVALTIAIRPQVDPVLLTLDATGIGYDRVTLNGRLDFLFSSSVTLWFEWGNTTALGNDSADAFASSTGPFSIVLTGLAENMTYYFRARSEESPSGYASNGSTLNFTTGERFAPFVFAINFVWVFGFIMVLILMIAAAWWIRERLA